MKKYALVTGATSGIGKEIALKLTQKGFSVIAVGRNQAELTILSEKYGSKVRLATILTDIPLQAEMPVIENGCGSCELCKNACPAGAIFGEIPNGKERNYDPEKCSRYMKEHFQDIGRGSVCGICIKVCPKNKL